MPFLIASSRSAPRRRLTRPLLPRPGALALLILAPLSLLPSIAVGAGPGIAIERQSWPFQGGLNAIFGTFDRASLQRGFQVYDQVCAACHSMSLLSYRNLGEQGGPHFPEASVKAIAAEKLVPDDAPDEDGEIVERPGLPRDRFVSPYANDQEARAVNGGALPPDLSVIVKARGGGADYIYALLIGYRDAPDNLDIDDDLYFNAYYPGLRIKMPPPLIDDLIEYGDGTPATVENMARDVTAFLAWAAEPHMESRRRIGFVSILMLAVISGLFYFSMHRLWRDRR